MLNKKIRVMSAVIALLSMLAIIPLMFEFYSYFFEHDFVVWGFMIYTDKENWVYILLGVLGLIGLIWDLSYGAYAIMDGRYKNLTWRIARYGYFYGAVVGIINLAFLISFTVFARLWLAAWVFMAFIIAIVTLKIILVFTKECDYTKL